MRKLLPQSQTRSSLLMAVVPRRRQTALRLYAETQLTIFERMAPSGTWGRKCWPSMMETTRTGAFQRAKSYTQERPHHDA